MGRVGSGSWSVFKAIDFSVGNLKKINRRLKEKIEKKDFHGNPKELIVACAQANQETGSSTFVVAALDSHLHQLNFAFIGDSSRKSN